MIRSKQRVLLINPEESRTIWTLSGIIDDEPLDLEMIYTVLKQNNIEVKIFDKEFSEEDKRYLNSLVERRLAKLPDLLLFPEEHKAIIIEFKSPDVNV